MCEINISRMRHKYMYIISAAEKQTREIHPGAHLPVWKEFFPGVTRVSPRWISRVTSVKGVLVGHLD